MQLEMVAIKDRALDAFMRPFFVQTVAQGIRMFGDEASKPDGEMSKHLEDYDLYHLGSWDDATGRLEQLEQPKQIAIGKHYRPQVPN